METVTPQQDELSISVSSLNNMAGMAWTCDDEEIVIISFKRINNFFSANAECCGFKISTDISGDFQNRREVRFRFKLREFRKFVKKLSSYYKKLEGKAFIRLHNYKIEVTMPSMIGLNLHEIPMGFYDRSEG